MVILMLIFVILTISAFGLLGDLCSEGFDVGCSTYFHFLCIQSSRAYMDTSQNVVQLLPPPVPLLFPSPITRGAEGSQGRSVDAFFWHKDWSVPASRPSLIKHNGPTYVYGAAVQRRADDGDVPVQAWLTTMGLGKCTAQQPKKHQTMADRSNQTAATLKHCEEP